MTQGLVVSLDRGYPLVRTKQGEERAQHAIDLVKNSDMRAAVGDIVDVSREPGQDTLFITAIQERTSTLVRRELVESIHDGAGKSKEQVLAANFDMVAVVQSLGKRPMDLDYLERQLVMAHQSDVKVMIILTKADVAKHLHEDITATKAAAPGCTVLCMANKDGKDSGDEPVELVDRDQLAAYFAPQRLGVLLGRSGVGKSTLVNLLLGEERQATGSVRKKDNAGRHVTVARRLVDLPKGGAVIDTPGLRAIGVHGAELGLAKTFPEITAAAVGCRYRNCTHSHEPGCAVIAAVEEGSIPQRRLDSYCVLAAEVFD